MKDEYDFAKLGKGRVLDQAWQMEPLVERASECFYPNAWQLIITNKLIVLILLRINKSLFMIYIIFSNDRKPPLLKFAFRNIFNILTLWNHYVILSSQASSTFALSFWAHLYFIEQSEVIRWEQPLFTLHLPSVSVFSPASMRKVSNLQPSEYYPLVIPKKL